MTIQPTDLCLKTFSTCCISINKYSVVIALYQCVSMLVIYNLITLSVMNLNHLIGYKSVNTLLDVLPEFKLSNT